MPVRAAFVLYSAMGIRYDLQPQGPTYVEQEMIAAIDRIEAKLKTESRKRKK
jgi:hypothetical protein